MTHEHDFASLPSKFTAIHIDWISITIKPDEISKQWETAHMLPLIVSWDDIYKTKGQNGYDMAFFYDCGAKIMASSTRPDMGVHIIFSGETLRKIEQRHGYDGFQIIEWYKGRNINYSRVDACVDAIGFDASAEHYNDLYLDGQCTNKRTPVVFIKNHKGQGDTLYIGSLKSRRKLLRIYDKGKQTGLHEDWTRFEIQFSRGYANTFIQNLSSKIDGNISAVRSSIKGWADFPEDDTFQAIFTDNAVKIMHTDKSDSDTENWLLSTVAKTLAKTCLTDDLFLHRFMEAFRDETGILKDKINHEKEI